MGWSREQILLKLTQIYGQYKTTSYSYEFRFNCPYCSRIKTPDRKYHLYINVDNLVGYCFRCQTILSPRQLKRLLGFQEEVLYVSLPSHRQSTNYLVEIPDFMEIENTEAFDFLFQKYVPTYTKEQLLDFCRYYSIVYCPKFYSIGIPLFWFGELVGFQMRSLDINAETKYKYLTYAMKGFSLTGYLFNYDKSLLQEYQEIYLVEGIFDGLPFYLANKGWIALFGKNVSKDRLQLLSSLKGKKVIIALDGDAKKEAYQLAYKLYEKFYFEEDVYILELPEDKDPGELGLAIFEVGKEVRYEI